MDSVFDYKNIPVLKSMLTDSNVRQTIRLLRVFGGGQQVIYVTFDDKVYAFGDNRYGNLGLGLKDFIKTETLIEELSNKQLIDMAPGLQHCLGLTSSGRIYAWGQNRFGQLGIKQDEELRRPGLVENFARVTQICCGNFHSMALTIGGELFFWGDNRSQKLFNISDKKIKTPTKVIISDRFSSISSGIWHSIAVSVNGRLFIWGNMFDQNDRISSTETSYKPIEGLVYISKAVCGPNHSLILTSEGTVFGFGLNSNGQIGNGTVDIQLVPIQLRFKSKIKDIIASNECHISIAISEDNNCFVWGLVKRKVVSKPKSIDDSPDKVFDIYAKYSKLMFKTLVIKNSVNKFNNNTQNKTRTTIEKVFERSTDLNENPSENEVLDISITETERLILFSIGKIKYAQKQRTTLEMIFRIYNKMAIKKTQFRDKENLRSIIKNMIHKKILEKVIGNNGMISYREINSAVRIVNPITDSDRKILITIGKVRKYQRPSVDNLFNIWRKIKHRKLEVKESLQSLLNDMIDRQILKEINHENGDVSYLAINSAVYFMKKRFSKPVTYKHSRSLYNHKMPTRSTTPFDCTSLSTIIRQKSLKSGICDNDDDSANNSFISGFQDDFSPIYSPKSINNFSFADDINIIPNNESISHVSEVATNEEFENNLNIQNSISALNANNEDMDISSQISENQLESTSTDANNWKSLYEKSDKINKQLSQKLSKTNEMLKNQDEWRLKFNIMKEKLKQEVISSLRICQESASSLNHHLDKCLNIINSESIN